MMRSRSKRCAGRPRPLSRRLCPQHLEQIAQLIAGVMLKVLGPIPTAELRKVRERSPMKNLRNSFRPV